MKKFLLVVLIAIASLSNNLFAQSNTLDEHVNKIFTALKAKDEKAFVALFPGYDQMKQLMRDLYESMKDVSGKTANIDSLLEAEFSKMTEEKFRTEMQNEFRESFKEFIEKGEKKGIVWANIGLVKIMADSTSDNLSMGMTTGKGILEISENDKKYSISFNDAIWMKQEKGWFGVNLGSIRGEGEPEEEEEFDMHMDSLAIPPIDTTISTEKKPVKKTTTPVKKTTAPVKKTTTPATKPKTTTTKPKKTN